MIGRVLIKGLDRRRLRGFVALFFLALALPTGFLVWQAYGQLKWESFHQYRGMAEELTNRIDASLRELVVSAEDRTFSDYTFLVVTGDVTANFLQRSVLSTYPVPQDLPGLMGYFQVGTQGEFSTPFLPTGNVVPESYGISQPQYAERLALAVKIRAVLSDNRLVESRLAPADNDGLARDREQDSADAGGKQDGPLATDMSASRIAAAVERQALDSQLAFDELKQERSRAYGSDDAYSAAEETASRAGDSRQRKNKLGRVADLNLDAAYQNKSVGREQLHKQVRELEDKKQSETTQRVPRKEQTALPERVLQPAGIRADNSQNDADVRITTFESEVDPLEFSLLDSGHFVLFRKVWREGERFIQGMLLEQRPFILDRIDQPFQETALSQMSDLIVAYQDDVLHTASGGRYGSFALSSENQLRGSLLYRSRLSAPLDSIELIYTVKNLPPGPGGEVLAWASLVLGLVFCSGFYALYRTGLHQIGLVEQQQDFVSAVSHELKTPLTSIRMYGEMLKEGWAAEDKKQAYYEFIHDESERLSRLISNVLQLANISRNEPQLEMKAVSVREIMAGIKSKVTTQVDRAGFELLIETDVDAETASIRIDSDCFTQIIINLADNAIKFSRSAETKRIEIRARLAGQNKVLFTVRDFGPGIPRDQMRKIFDMFYRSESELTRETVGTGIGLAIVHQLGVAMGAEVDVVNKDPGAEFRVFVSVNPEDAGNVFVDPT